MLNIILIEITGKGTERVKKKEVLVKIIQVHAAISYLLVENFQKNFIDTYIYNILIQKANSSLKYIFHDFWNIH